MKISLKAMMEMKENEGKSFLELKAELKRFKESGELFFKEDISSVGFEEEFEIWFYYTPSIKTHKKAFPVPRIDFFQLSRDEEKRKNELVEFYEKYYETTAQKGFFSRYDYKTFIADEFVWLYRES